MNSSSRNNSIALKMDSLTVLIYLILVVMGWFSIYAAVYNPEDSGFILDISKRYGMQIVWIALSFTLAVIIILLDSKYFHMFSYHIYWAALLMMLGVLVFGKEVNGAKSWIGVGSIGIQPVEFMKIAAALALARFMSSFHFSLGRRQSVLTVALIIFVPILLVLLQNDTGSALVFFAFFLVLYREGVGAVIYLVTLYFMLIAVLSFFVSFDALVLCIFLSCLSFEFMSYHRQGALRPVLRYLGGVMLVFVGVWLLSLVCGFGFSLSLGLVVGVLCMFPFVVRWVLKGFSRSALWYFVLFLSAVSFIFVVDYTFENILQPHQKERILDLTGIVSDPQGAGYNAMQSKIAIGSGGVFGKGFLEGTQTRFSFVPEQSTDFIFCTIGEEWGFFGSVIVLSLFGLLIYRLMRMGERQKEPFARIYCYSAAAIILFHVLINISMTIGLFPIIGIPLPFFSYGGSSLMAFSVLVFIAIRLDASQVD